MSKLSIMIQFNREITDKDLACIGLGGIYLKTNNSYIGLDYMDVEKTKEGKNLILFRLKNEDIDTFPDMVKLQDILKEDGLIVDELNIEYDPIDILPIYPMQIYFFMFTFNSDPIKLSNGIVIENQITRMLLNNKHYKKIYKDWKEDLIGMGK
mgnify:FL=1|jgi:hypothetical protein